MKSMAKPRDPFFDYVEEILAPMGPVTIKRMFGGAGVYAHGVMFALLADGEIYLKADLALKAELEREGSGPFIFRKKDGSEAVMSYYRLPSDASDDPEAASAWGRRALDAALKARQPKSKRAPNA